MNIADGHRHVPLLYFVAHRPSVEHTAGELRPVIKHDHIRLATTLYKPIYHPHYSLPWQ